MRNRKDTKKILEVKNLKQYFYVGSGSNKLTVKAVDDISFDVHEKEVFGLVGESGCGKTTTGRTILKIYKPTAGTVKYKGDIIGQGDLNYKAAIKNAREKYKQAKIKVHVWQHFFNKLKSLLLLIGLFALFFLTSYFVIKGAVRVEKQNYIMKNIFHNYKGTDYQKYVGEKLVCEGGFMQHKNPLLEESFQSRYYVDLLIYKARMKKEDGIYITFPKLLDQQKNDISDKNRIALGLYHPYLSLVYGSVDESKVESNNLEYTKDNFLYFNEHTIDPAMPIFISYKEIKDKDGKMLPINFMLIKTYKASSGEKEELFTFTSGFDVVKGGNTIKKSAKNISFDAEKDKISISGYPSKTKDLTSSDYFYYSLDMNLTNFLIFLRYFAFVLFFALVTYFIYFHKYVYTYFRIKKYNKYAKEKIEVPKGKIIADIKAYFSELKLRADNIKNFKNIKKEAYEELKEAHKEYSNIYRENKKAIREAKKNDAIVETYEDREKKNIKKYELKEKFKKDADPIYPKRAFDLKVAKLVLLFLIVVLYIALFAVSIIAGNKKRYDLFIRKEANPNYLINKDVNKYLGEYFKAKNNFIENKPFLELEQNITDQNHTIEYKINFYRSFVKGKDAITVIPERLLFTAKEGDLTNFVFHKNILYAPIQVRFSNIKDNEMTDYVFLGADINNKILVKEPTIFMLSDITNSDGSIRDILDIKYNFEYLKGRAIQRVGSLSKIDILTDPVYFKTEKALTKEELSFKEQYGSDANKLRKDTNINNVSINVSSYNYTIFIYGALIVAIFNLIIYLLYINPVFTRKLRYRLAKVRTNFSSENDKKLNEIYLSENEIKSFLGIKEFFQEMKKDYDFGKGKESKYKEYIKLRKDYWHDLRKLRTKKAIKLVSDIQMIFQDPISSLNPRMTVREIITEGLRIQGGYSKHELDEKVRRALDYVGLTPNHLDRYPHEFSGGQRQRIGIARALVVNPGFIIADEPVSALDVSIQAQVINLLNDLKDRLGLTILFVAHDLSVVKYFCDRIAVMYFGKIVEEADSDVLFKNPLHPYTKSLLSAIPNPDPITERTRERVIYDNRIHNYSVDKPSVREVEPDHFVYCNDEEFAKYQEELKRNSK